jgi:hypothetical protein
MRSKPSAGNSAPRTVRASTTRWPVCATCSRPNQPNSSTGSTRRAASTTSRTWCKNSTGPQPPNPIGATSRDLRVFKDKTEVAKLAAQSAEVISLPKGQTDPFARHAQSLLMPATGFIDGYKDRAKTAVSSREVIQTLAELEADKAGLDLQNTLELSKRLQQVATVQVLTNNQLAKIHQAIISEQEQKSLEFQAALEEKLSSAYSDAAQSSATFGSAGSLMVQNTNSASFDGFLGRF